MNIRHQNIGIVGMGVEGKSTFSWLKKHKAKKIFCFDEKSEVEKFPTFSEEEEKKMKEIFAVTFGELQQTHLQDAEKNVICYQKGSRKYGANHFRKHLKRFSAGYVSVYESLYFFIKTIEEGKRNEQRTIVCHDGSITFVIEKEINGTLFQAVIRDGKEGKYIISFFSDRYFSVYEKTRVGLHLGQPISRLGEKMISYQEEKYQEEKINPHLFHLSDIEEEEDPLPVLPFFLLSHCQTLFRSPGIHPQKIQKFLPENWKGKISSATQFFLEHSPTKNIIGITGTKGKGTTSTLIFEILKEHFSQSSTRNSKINSKFFLGGNIGTPIFDFFDEITKNDVVVLEMSSFQLYDITISPKISVVLRTDTEHLDWHFDTEDYRNAKKNIFRYQKKNDTLVYFAGSEMVSEMVKDAVSEKIAVFPVAGKGEKSFALFLENEMICGNFGGIVEKIFPVSSVALRGKFHLENVLAACAVAKKCGVSAKTMEKVVKNFVGLPMRCQLVAEKNGRKFFDDSFSTIPETTISALSTFNSPVFLILGGSEKFSDFTELSQKIAENKNIKMVYLIGHTSNRIAEKFEKFKIQNFTFKNSLEECFIDFTQNSKENDSLLLSPGCASFGMFKNYKERGEKFDALAKEYRH